MQTTQALSSEIDLERLLEKIMALSIQNAGAQKVFLILENDKDKKLYIEATGRVDEKIEVLQSIPLDNSDSMAVSIVNYVNKTGENIVLNDAAADQRFINDPYIIANHPKSILCAPIMHKGKSAGIIYLENNLTTDAFTRERLELLKIFSAQAAISIENSRLLSQREQAAKLKTEMEIAANIQTALLPEKPAIAGYTITAYMSPADDIGGDYYDIINCPDKDWVIIGDVSGHGVPAGLVMMMVQTAIQTVLRQFPGIRPSELLHKTNQTICYNVQKMKVEKYVTITALCFDGRGGVVFSGLHQDIMVFRAAAGEVETVKSDGIWLSPWKLNQKEDDLELKLDKGDVLLLYTDGITEAEDSEGAMFSYARLLNVFKKNGYRTTEEIKNSIMKELKDFKCNDDVTMVLLKRTP